MEVEDAIEALNVALRLQQRSVIAYTHMAGTLVGFQFHGLAAEMASFARAELDDARHLVEKITTLGGDATIEIAPIERADDPEALEHRLEHIIMRKQEQVDALIRAAGGPEGL